MKTLRNGLLYESSVPVFQHYLGQLTQLLGKTSDDQLLDARLAPDMHSLRSQIQTCCDFALRACAPLAGLEIPQFARDEADLADMRRRVERTQAYLQGLEPSTFDADVFVTTTAGLATHKLSANVYLHRYVLPNFFFHLSMVYAILRSRGVDVGKADFDGYHQYA